MHLSDEAVLYVCVCCIDSHSVASFCLFMLLAAFPDSFLIQEGREPAQGSDLPEGIPDPAG